MRDKLEKIIIAYQELEKKLSDPSVAGNIKEFTRLNKEYAHQTDLVNAAREYIAALDDIDVAKEMLREAADAEEKEMLQMEISENEEKLPQLEEDIKFMLIPSDPNDEKNTIVEIRSAAGGDEAAIFAGDLFKMYQRFIESKKWKMTVLDSSPSEAGGFKSIEFKIEGDKVYSVMKYESGVHRVQRVPKTESQGRIQTSTATVAVLLDMDPDDLNNLGAMRNAFWTSMSVNTGGSNGPADPDTWQWKLDAFNQGPAIAALTDWENGPKELRGPNMPLWKPIVQ
jgi:peptide chain release factor 1